MEEKLVQSRMGRPKMRSDRSWHLLTLSWRTNFALDQIEACSSLKADDSNAVLGTRVVPADCSSHELVQAPELSHSGEAEILGILKSLLLKLGASGSGLPGHRRPLTSSRPIWISLVPTSNTSFGPAAPAASKTHPSSAPSSVSTSERTVR